MQWPASILRRVKYRYLVIVYKTTGSCRLLKILEHFFENEIPIINYNDGSVSSKRSHIYLIELVYVGADSLDWGFKHGKARKKKNPLLGKGLKAVIVARPIRFERTTCSLGNCCSILLSYGRALDFSIAWETFLLQLGNDD